MKKLIQITFVAIGALMISSFVRAQEVGHSNIPVFGSDKDVYSGISDEYQAGNKTGKAQWDIVFNYNVTDSACGLGNAAVCYFNNAFWVARWANDTLYELNNQGSLISYFIISGLSGTRSLTWDGTYIYAGTAANTIYRINPNTKALAPPHITVAGAARFVTYDATLDGGSGGFWYGNFNTDIVAVDMTGTVLTTIPVATHGLSGMYGAAVDNVSTGGPYLWVFTQMAPNSSQVKAISLPSGAATIYDHDAMSDVGLAMGLTSGLGGGMFLSSDVDPGNLVLIGLLQGTPSNVIFGYDIDITGSVTDLEAISLRSTEGYTQIPVSQVFPETFELSVRNSGTEAFDSVYAELEYFYNGSPVGTETMTTTNLASMAAYDFTSAVFTPSNGAGLYEVLATVHPGLAQTDTINDNDTVSFSFMVTDSVFARDNGIPDGGAGYAVSSTNWAYATSNFEVFAPDTLAGIWIQLATAIQGDTTYAVLASTAAGTPNTVLETGVVHIIDSTMDEYFLEFASPVPMAVGTYAFGCYEGTNTLIYLAQGPNVYTAGVNFFYTSSAWSPSGIQTARFIRPCFTNVTASGVDQHIKAEFSVSVFPNPAVNQINIIYNGTNAQQAVVSLMEASGRVVLENTLNTTAGNNLQMDVSTFPQGFYLLEIKGDNLHEVHKILISR